MSNTVECDFLIATVKAGHGKNGIPIVKNIGGAVGIGQIQFVTEQQRLRLHAEIFEAGGIDPYHGAPRRVAVKIAIR